MITMVITARVGNLVPVLVSSNLTVGTRNRTQP